MIRSGLLLIPAILIVASCGGGADRKEAEFAGGTLTLALENEPTTYIAREVTDVYSQAVLSQVIEPLVTINPQDLSIRPQVAKSWKVSPDGLTYTFTLRDDVLFHPHEVFGSDDERLMTAADVKYSIEKACLPNPKNQPTAAFTSIYKELLKGAQEFYDKKTSAVSGITIKGNEISLTLISPDASFINKMSLMNTGIVSEKIGKVNLEGEMIGTGPFKYETASGNESIILTKNEDYYVKDKEGNSLPYLDSVVYRIEPRKLVQLEMFEKGEIQLINSLPTSRISQMLEGRIKDFNSVPPKIILYNNPLLYTQYYFFNMTDPRFKDPRVRQAFNYAINRNKLTEEVLRRQAYENGIYGMVPPISSNFKGYDFSSVKAVGYDYDPEKARKLLAEAGFPGGKGFGSVNLRVNIGDVHSAVAEELSEQIFQSLGINMNIDGSTFEQKNEDADYARGDIFRGAWQADYNSPETFLMNFYGKYVPSSMTEASKINQARYINPVFDNYYMKARIAQSQSERYKLYNKAEIELMKDPPVIILWYAGDMQLMQSRVRNLKQNSLGLIDLREVYLKDWTKEEYLKTVQVQ